MNEFELVREYLDELSEGASGVIMRDAGSFTEDVLLYGHHAFGHVPTVGDAERVFYVVSRLN